MPALIHLTGKNRPDSDFLIARWLTRFIFIGAARFYRQIQGGNRPAL
ncbi:MULTISPECIES: hypothetical protein [unclassified Brenneria]|nr:hypothetical protein [Brenneria sp. hezel4-2-4]